LNKNTSGADFLLAFRQFLLEFVFQEEINATKPLIDDKDFIIKNAEQGSNLLHEIVITVVYLQWVLFYIFLLVYHLMPIHLLRIILIIEKRVYVLC
jgi:hypothetical protein